MNPKYFFSAIALPRWKRTTKIAAMALPACSDLYKEMLLSFPNHGLDGFCILTFALVREHLQVDSTLKGNTFTYGFT
ncbi:hypothetical protein CCP3SC1_1180005 [Gammaproteobacteria bacterium]